MTYFPNIEACSICQGTGCEATSDFDEEPITCDNCKGNGLIDTRIHEQRTFKTFY